MEWRKVKECPKDLWVSDSGELRNEEGPVNPHNVRGYKRLPRGYGLRRGVHKIMWEAFYGPIPEGMSVDHKNRKPGDNRLSNLRLATPAQQNVNSVPVRDPKSARHTPYIGVTRNQSMNGQKKLKGFRGQIQVRGKKYITRTFACPTAAALARDRLAVKNYGEFAILNFPPP